MLCDALPSFYLGNAAEDTTLSPSCYLCFYLKLSGDMKFPDSIYEGPSLVESIDGDRSLSLAKFYSLV